MARVGRERVGVSCQTVDRRGGPCGPAGSDSDLALRTLGDCLSACGAVLCLGRRSAASLASVNESQGLLPSCLQVTTVTAVSTQRHVSPGEPGAAAGLWCPA